MGRFVNIGGHTTLVLEGAEDELMPQLIGQLLDVLTHDSDPPLGGGQVSDDPFAQWEASFSEADSIEDSTFADPDPITARLFPQAYTDDPEASYDFRRFTMADQRRQKIEDCRIVLADLEHGGGRVPIPADHLQAWLKTLNNLRLVLAVLLGITDEISADEAAQLPDDDPRGVVHHYYAWLGWMLESLMSCLIEPFEASPPQVPGH